MPLCLYALLPPWVGAWSMKRRPVFPRFAIATCGLCLVFSRFNTASTGLYSAFLRFDTASTGLSGCDTSSTGLYMHRSIFEDVYCE